MPRKYDSTERFLTPDPRYGSKLVSRFVNCLMHDGKKTTAFRVFYDATDLLKKKVPDQDALDTFVTALGNVKPMVSNAVR